MDDCNQCEPQSRDQNSPLAQNGSISCASPQQDPLTQTPSSQRENPPPTPAEANAASTTPQAARKRGKYLPHEDLIIVREVAASKAHVAKYGETKKQFMMACRLVNQNPNMRQKVSWKPLQDRYKRLQDEFDSEDTHHQGLSGVAGGELGEMYQLLSQLREERESFVNDRNADKNLRQKRDEEKERMGREIVEMALRRKRERSTPNTSGSVSALESPATQREEDVLQQNGEASGRCTQATKRRRRESVEEEGEPATFGQQLKEADLARLGFDREQLEFEQEKYMKELGERERDREECRKEREDTLKHELKKFKIMFDSFRSRNSG